MAKALPWTPAQDALLRKHHGVLSGEEIARLVGRTKKACGARASKWGIRSLHTGLRASEVAPELGVSIPTVTRWIEIGLLQASRKTTYEESQKPRWYVIQEEAIIRFLQTHYLKYDPSRLKKRWKKYVPREERAKWISIAEASAKHDRTYHWFYRLIWNGEISATKGWRVAGGTTYLYRQDIESVKARIHGTGGIRPFAERRNAKPRGGYKKGARRGRQTQ